MRVCSGILLAKFPGCQDHEAERKNKQMKEALEDFDIIGYAKLNAEFHQLIYEESTNKVLIENIRNLWKRLDSIRGIGSTLYSGRVKESIKEHEEIISLLEKKRIRKRSRNWFARINYAQRKILKDAVP